MIVEEKVDSIMDAREIMNLIPHRYPFLLVDKVISLDFETGVIVAQKAVTINEPFFRGHFPQQPIMPGVLIIEALAQVGGIYISKKGIEELKALVSVSDFKFRRPVVPGDLLTLSVEVTHTSSVGGKCKGVASVDGRKCAEGSMTFSIFKENLK